MAQKRPDSSEFLAHFSVNRAPYGDKTRKTATGKMNAQDRIISILRDKTIRASTMPWTGAVAVCFTECPWASLIGHAANYSPYGIGFHKKAIFAAGGGPVYYVRQDIFNAVRDDHRWHENLWPFVTPFSPPYRPSELQAEEYLGGKSVDYTHEREWRTTVDFTFEYDDVEFVIVNTYEDLAKFPADLKDGIGRAKFLIMDVYRNIERLWPTHIM